MLVNHTTKTIHHNHQHHHQALSLTGVNDVSNDLSNCHQIKGSEKVITKFKCHKQKKYMYKCKNLGNKSQELSNLQFCRRFFVSESVPYENQQLAYKCQ